MTIIDKKKIKKKHEAQQDKNYQLSKQSIIINYKLLIISQQAM